MNRVVIQSSRINYPRRTVGGARDASAFFRRGYKIQHI